MPEERVPKEHIELMLLLRKTLTTGALEDMKLAVAADEFGGFKDAELEEIKDVRQMLVKLQVRGVMGVGNYGKLREIMRDIGSVAVIRFIDNTEKLLNEKAPNTEMTSKRVAELLQPLENSIGLNAPTSPRAGNKRPSSEHQSTSDASGIDEKKLCVLAPDRTDVAQTSDYAPTSPRAGNKRPSSEHQSTSDASSIEKMLRDLAKNIGKDWKQLATSLGITAAQIEIYQSDYPSDMKEQVFRMLLDWFREQTILKEAKGKLEVALFKLGRADQC